MGLGFKRIKEVLSKPGVNVDGSQSPLTQNQMIDQALRQIDEEDATSQSQIMRNLEERTAAARAEAEAKMRLARERTQQATTLLTQATGVKPEQVKPPSAQQAQWGGGLALLAMLMGDQGDFARGMVGGYMADRDQRQGANNEEAERARQMLAAQAQGEQALGQFDIADAEAANERVGQAERSANTQFIQQNQRTMNRRSNAESRRQQIGFNMAVGQRNAGEIKERLELIRTVPEVLNFYQQYYSAQVQAGLDPALVPSAGELRQMAEEKARNNQTNHLFKVIRDLGASISSPDPTRRNSAIAVFRNELSQMPGITNQPEFAQLLEDMGMVNVSQKIQDERLQQLQLANSFNSLTLQDRVKYQLEMVNRIREQITASQEARRLASNRDARSAAAGQREDTYIGEINNTVKAMEDLMKAQGFSAGSSTYVPRELLNNPQYQQLSQHLNRLLSQPPEGMAADPALQRYNEQVATTLNEFGQSIKDLFGFGGAASTAPPSGAGSFGSPLSNYRVSSEYGMRRHPTHGDTRLHSGIDMAAPMGTAVAVTAPGVVTFAGERGGYGNFIIVDHGGGYVTRYAHLSRINVRVGQQVGGGATIGLVGATGNATGPHLHYEVLVNGRSVDPRGYLSGAPRAQSRTPARSQQDQGWLERMAGSLRGGG